MTFDLEVSLQFVIDSIIAENAKPQAIKRAKARVKAGERAYRVARELMDNDGIDEALEELSDGIYAAIEDAMFDRITND